VRRTAFLCALVVVLCPTTSAARHRHHRHRHHHRHRARWLSRIGLEQAYTDNLQAQPGPLRQGEWLTTLDGYVALEKPRRWWLPDRSSFTLRSRFFRRFPAFDYVELQPEISYLLGKRTEFSALYGFTPKRLLFAVNDGGPGVFYREHLVWLTVRHKFGREKRLRTRLISETRWRDFRPPSSTRTGSILGGSLRLRYMFAPLLAPQFEAKFTQRDTRRENFDRDRFDVGGGLIARLPYGINARFRYVRSWRNYTVGEARDVRRSNSNFRRDDDIQKFDTLVFMPLPWLKGLDLQFHHLFRNGHSNRADRNFKTHEYGLRISYTFGGAVGG